MFYCYLDHYGIMHATDNMEDAKKNAKFNGKVVTTSLPTAAGYVIDANRDAFILDANDKIYRKRKEVYSETEMIHKYPEVWNLFKSLQ